MQNGILVKVRNHSFTRIIQSEIKSSINKYTSHGNAKPLVKSFDSILPKNLPKTIQYSIVLSIGSFAYIYTQSGSNKFQRKYENHSARPSHSSCHHIGKQLAMFTLAILSLLKLLPVVIFEPKIKCHS
jgi:hypothetical protein